MQSPSITSGRAEKVDAGWSSGMNTIRNPWILRDDQYRRGQNIVNRGAVIQTRPGFRMSLILPKGNFQGAQSFRVTKDDIDLDYMVAAVDGIVYALPFPLAQPKNWSDFKIPNLKFDAKADFLYFCTAEKTLTLSDDSNLKIVPTYNVLMVQDGINPCGYWDGTISAHLDEASPKLETPKGTWMVFSGGRLWLARGKLLLASDYLDPLRFSERVTGQGRGDFYLKKNITGLVNFISSGRSEAVVAFDEDQSDIFQSGIKDRDQWPLTPDFQQPLFPGTGCIAGRSITFQAGLMWWYSAGGLVSSDSAASNNLTSQVNFKDAEMAASKQFLADDQSGICGLSFENYLLMAMPVKQNLNSEIFVLDYATMSELSAEKIPAWSSVWTGIRPIQFISVNVNGKKRAFAASIDYVSVHAESYNVIWEIFQPNREDSFFTLDQDGTSTEYFQRIYCEWESRSLGDGLDLKAFDYAQINAIEISGDLDVKTAYRGRRGAYKELKCESVVAPTDYRNVGVDLTDIQRKEYGNLRKQSRTFTTESAKPFDGCGCENVHGENIDRSFSLLVSWCGQMAIESVRVFMDAYAEKTTAEPNEKKDDKDVCLALEDGSNVSLVRKMDYIPEEDLYQAIVTKNWISTKSFQVELNCPTGSITGPIIINATATYVSKVSKENADSQALQAATDAAQSTADYYRTVFPCLWEGLEYATRTCTSALNGEVTCLRERSDGVVIIGGLFTTDNSVSQNFVSARNPDGTRKLDFISGLGADNSMRAIAIDSQDRALISGQWLNFNNQGKVGFTRLTTEGEIDADFAYVSFLGGGTPQRNGMAIEVNGSGQIFLAGFFSSYGGVTGTLNSGIVRLDANGYWDNTFVSDGGLKWVYAIALSGAKVYIAGWDTASASAKLIRLNADGSVDSGFAEYLYSKVNKVEIRVQPDGKVLFAGEGINSAKGIIRLNTDGTTDGTFSVGTGFNDKANSIDLLASGKVLVGGNFTAYNGTACGQIVRLNSNGSIDNTFSSPVMTVVPGKNYVSCVRASSTGGIIAGGNFITVNGNPCFSYAIFGANGNYIPAFEYVIALGVARTPLGQAQADSLAQSVAMMNAQAQLPCS